MWWLLGHCWLALAQHVVATLGVDPSKHSRAPHVSLAVLGLLTPDSLWQCCSAWRCGLRCNPDHGTLSSHILQVLPFRKHTRQQHCCCQDSLLSKEQAAFCICYSVSLLTTALLEARQINATVLLTQAARCSCTFASKLQVRDGIGSKRTLLLENTNSSGLLLLGHMLTACLLNAGGDEAPWLATWSPPGKSACLTAQACQGM